MTKERIYYWDNFKALLIFLVVLVHFLIPISHNGKSIMSVYYFIYFFHMPAFVFAGGYFAKYYMKKDIPKINRLVGFLILFLAFKGMLWIVRIILEEKAISFDFFTEGGAPWFLLCMFFWYIYLPVFAKLKPVVSIGFTVILGLLIGLEAHFGAFLSLSRCVVFFPFFLAGYFFKEDIIKKITSIKVRVGAIILLIIIVILFMFNLDLVDKYSSILYGVSSYAGLGISNIKAIILRLIWYIVSTVITLVIMCIIPKRKTIVTYIGSRTLAIYIIHRIIRQVFESKNIYQYFDGNSTKVLIEFVLISLIVTFILSWEKLTILFDQVFKINYSKLMIKN